MKPFIPTLCLCLLALLPHPLRAQEAVRDSILSLITGAELPTRTRSITAFGARGDGRTDCKPAFDKAMQRAAKQGGLHLVVPAGEYLINGPIHLVSNVCLDLAEGATLRFSSNPEHYLPMVATSWEGTFLQNYSPFIYAYRAENVSIIGRGTIDGNATESFAEWRAQQRPGRDRSRQMNHDHTPVADRTFGPGYYLRPHLIQFYECRGVTVEDVFITRSPFWCIHLLASENVICRGVRYDAKLENNDGIDPEYARNVLIENIDFNNGDDNVAIKSGRDDDGRAAQRPTGGIIIRNCRFKGLHGVVFGSEMSAGVEQVYIEDCTYGGYCKRGIYMKTNPDRGGFIRDVYIRNCHFDEVEDLFYITSKYAGEGQDNHYFTDVHDIYVTDLTCRRARHNAVVLQGTPQQPLRQISLTRVQADEAGVGLSMSAAEGITFTDCNLGGYVDVPTVITDKDGIFQQDKK